jgi:GxxExxY protein
VKINELTEKVIGAAMDVHRALGPGLLESAYEACLARELTMQGIAFEQQVELPVVYRGVPLSCGYRLDFLVENELILELKAVEKLLPIHEAQLLTYLKLSDKRIGLLINFNVTLLKQGLHRIVNQLSETSAPSAPLR